MEENPDVSFVPTAQRKAAAGIARKLLKEAGVVCAPVSLRVIIEHLQKGHDVTVKGMTDVSTKVSGLLVHCKDGDDEHAVIGFNQNHPICRQRFTIAHEIGHLLMGHTCSQRDNDGSFNETEANAFASELLMPRQFLMVDFLKIKDIPSLARVYRVSSEAMGYQLMQTKLLK